MKAYQLKLLLVLALSSISGFAFADLQIREGSKVRVANGRNTDCPGIVLATFLESNEVHVRLKNFGYWTDYEVVGFTGNDMTVSLDEIVLTESGLCSGHFCTGDEVSTRIEYSQRTVIKSGEIIGFFLNEDILLMTTHQQGDGRMSSPLIQHHYERVSPDSVR